MAVIFCEKVAAILFGAILPVIVFQPSHATQKSTII